MALKITQVRGTAGTKQNQKDSLRTLGLKRINDSAVRPDTPAVRGLVNVVRHLVEVEEVAGE
ncbi:MULTISPECIES: 50S ribosomal protein L30 [Corynebacterium]|uniref:Large ribosomal subunit protein uL30 n=1 Tax=Corynebacterium amycolatum TaxID=43765 RepID=A0AAW9STW8_CORAY|nr:MULTISPECIES: 50S ribosomal protein L30 [Corynebacterium]ASE57703.1 50S ribosomal protein L30 [Corynebacterium jeikeium]EEB63767.1 ribosomal protein L30 [Corynebacterium amycolatum SK46]EPD47927.1 50S ribosomal protein L30 [Corynebacterium sp. HFH0082]KAA0882570.1 50S ribosomal protein L30 [Corynebacterium amycolatum]KAA9224888.1 50S ribosomal protein L30 [Corynebacterium amycolatum]